MTYSKQSPKKHKTCVHTKSCKQMFIAVLFIITRIAKKWKNLLMSVSGNLWFIYTMEYYSSIKRSEALVSITTWMNLKTLCEVK